MASSVQGTSCIITFFHVFIREPFIASEFENLVLNKRSLVPDCSHIRVSVIIKRDKKKKEKYQMFS